MDFVKKVEGVGVEGVRKSAKEFADKYIEKNNLLKDDLQD